MGNRLDGEMTCDGCPSFDTNSAGSVQQLDLRSRQILEAPGKKNIEAESAILRTGLEFHFG